MRRLFIALLLLLGGPVGARAEVAVPPPALVVDQANALSAEDRAEVEAALRELKGTEHAADMAILIVDHVPDGDIEGYTLAVGRAWKLGDAKLNNGLLLVHAVKDRRYRFEVGPGLQGDIPDGAIGDIGREQLVPNFKAGNYKAAYLGAIAAVYDRLNPSVPQQTGDQSQGEQPDAAAEQPRASSDGSVTSLMMVLAIAVLFGIFARKNYPIAMGGTVASSAAAMHVSGMPAGFPIFSGALVGGFIAFVIAKVARNVRSGTTGTSGGYVSDSSSSSSWSSDSGSSSNDSSSFGGGDFDGGGASGDY